ncbi:MAG: Dam family site-specific DNA-(adenine-N6)-methyltransferase [Alphaproteobacteria bacterium]|nr:Dam family site-specific DNA-(adenine-N6)-methyltransferase [Alphaproteobacteria bacterium]
MQESLVKPILKWAGGKNGIIPQISKRYPKVLKKGKIKTYIEPFLGGGSVFLDIFNNYSFDKAYLFDINPELIILYKTLQENVEDFIDEISILKKKYEKASDKNEFYYKIRDKYNTFDKKINANSFQKKFIKRASFTLFLNKTCFNGLYRVNKDGYFNVPMGRYKNPNIYDENNLRAFSKALEKVEFFQCDFSKVLDFADENTFVYYDPPYRPIKKTSFNTYQSTLFDDKEQIRLKEIFDAVNDKKSFQMLSNSDPKNEKDDDFFDCLYEKYNIKRILVKRMINSNSKNRGKIKELLITNYD